STTKYEMIEIGADTYVYLAGKWTKTTGGSSDNLANPQSVLDAFDNPTDTNVKITKGGTETVNGIQCQDWNVKTAGTGSDPSNDGTMCVGLHDNLPVNYKQSTGKVVGVFSDWNAPIDIKPPI